ncbi:glycoside hydrolase family 28 protein [Mucilaginibacter aquatilis]|uniref:glycoside hydrolase family 28 protein n=1 Tax=Mucilaginibacter aquatilis TaxID=1517760 RepID=UPI0018DB4AB7|nr:glycosyl hydrolase family 28 protein [Mucilaginibacter aquatilis]
MNLKSNIISILVLTLPLIPLSIVRYNSIVKGKPSLTENKVYNIKNCGAKDDDRTVNTVVIQKVIDSCSANGGGTVLIPQGTFVSGALFIKPGVNLEIQKGGVLKGSVNIDDYPRQMTRIEGHLQMWRPALINAKGIHQLCISGGGEINGSGRPFWKLFYDTRTKVAGTANLDVDRPRLMFIEDSHDVKISGINFKDSGFWNLHLYRDKNVIVENCRFEAAHRSKPDDHAPSSDGIDVDSSQDIFISKCYFAVGDDDIALKGTKGPFAMNDKDSPPVERIRIADCVFEAGGGVVTCGSEATIVRDVTIERCVARGVNVLRLKLRPDTPQQYENISLSDITMSGKSQLLKVSPWTQYFDLKGQQPPSSLIKNISIKNVKGDCATLGEVKGTAKTTIHPIQLTNVTLAVATVNLSDSTFKNIALKNVVINGKAFTATR